LALGKPECQISAITWYAKRAVPADHYRIRSDIMNFRPLGDRVVIRRLVAEEKTTGGIIIPDTAQEKPMQGEVTAVGPGARNEQGQLVPLEVRTGDRVLFGKWSGTEVKLSGEELIIMKESDIMGIIQ
jgi:chaperonin GroES